MSPLPTMSDVRPVNPVLTDLSFGFKNPEYFWDKIAPPVSVPQKSGTYFIWTRDYWFRRQEGADRAPGGAYSRVGFGVETDTYDAQEIGWESVVDDVTRDASQTPESLDTQATAFLAEIMQIELEKLVAAATFVTSVWGTTDTLTGADQWSDYDASDPIGDADTAKRVIRRNTGAEPNMLFVGALTWEKLKEHPLLLDKYKHTQTGILTEALVAAALGVPELVVGKSVENTAVEKAPGTASFTGADIWTDNALFLMKTPSPGLMVPNGAYSFIWNREGNVPWGMNQYREEQTKSDVQRIFTHKDIKITASQYGRIILDTNA